MKIMIYVILHDICNTTQCLEGIYRFKYIGREKRLKNQLSKKL